METLGFHAIRLATHLSTSELGRLLEVNERTVRSWEQGRDPIPEGVAEFMLDLAARHDALARGYADTGTAVLKWDKRDYSKYPRAFYAAAVGRALGLNPHLKVKWDAPERDRNER